MKKQAVILFRNDYETEKERLIAAEYFPLVENRVPLQDSFVIGRYSVLPYYKELVQDLKNQNSELSDSFDQYNYIANFDYYEDLKDYTAKTWFRLEDIKSEKGPFILKGRTNSRKHQWSKFYAEDFKTATEIYCELMLDPLIAPQGVIIRQYEKLKNYGESLGGIPFAEEWRFFFYKGKLLSYGFYWTGAENPPDKSQIDPRAITLAQEIADVVKEKVNFFVVDVAQKENGEWILIELNSGAMSGLSGNDPRELYSNLAKIIKAE